MSMLFDIHNVTSTGGVEKFVIESAEHQLGMTFSDDFVEYLTQYGTVELGSSELFGLGVTGYRNIVYATNKERSLSDKFPTKYVVIYNLGINSILILLGEDGCIYEYTPKRLRKIFDSFTQWVVTEFINY